MQEYAAGCFECIYMNLRIGYLRQKSQLNMVLNASMNHTLSPHLADTKVFDLKSVYGLKFKA